MTEPDNRPIVTITNDVDFLAAVPSMVGLVPHQDLIVVAFSDTAEMVCTMRIGSRANPENIAQMLDVLDEQAHSVIAVIVDEDFDTAGTVSKQVVERLDEKVKGMYAMPKMETGSSFVELTSGKQGELLDYTTTDLAMLNAMDGKVLYNSPDEIMQMYSLADPPAKPRVFDNPEALAKAMTMMADAVANREILPPELVGGVMTFGEAVRDEMLNIIEVDPMDAHALFAHASRYLRGEARIQTLTAAGVAAYIAGEGLLTAASFDAAFETANQFGVEAKLANLVSKAYHQGMHPKKIRDLIIKEEVKKIRDNQ